MSKLEKRREVQRIKQEAAAWVLRSDRGLTADEQDGFSEWLAADPRHGAQLARHRRHWSRLDKLVQWLPEHSALPNPDLLAPLSRRPFLRFLPASLSLAAAAAIAAAFFAWKPDVLMPARDTPLVTAGPIQGPRVLPDGSTIELNRDAAVTVNFSANERRVRLEEGEAYFTVAKDAGRPFIVTAGGIDVRAVGTAFGVRMDAAVVEVLVTQGRVRIDSLRDTGEAIKTGLQPGDSDMPPGPSASFNADGSSAFLIPVLEANQRAVISLAQKPVPPEIATLTPEEIERMLSWQHRLLDFTAAPLSDVVAEFNRRNAVQLVLIDPELASIRISGSFRSDNIDGFLRLLEAGFNARAERGRESEIILRKAFAPQKP